MKTVRTFSMSNSEIIMLTLIYLSAINLVSMALFVSDKKAALKGGWRTSESTLLFVAFLGGSAGSVTAQHLIRHKTQKQPFKAQLYGIIVLQIAFAIALSFPSFRNLVGDLINDFLNAL